MDVTIPKGSTGVEPALLSFTQVCELLNCRPTKLRLLVRDGRMVAKMNGRQRMIPTSSVRAYIAGLPDAPATGRGV